VIATMRNPREGVLPRSERLRVVALDVTKRHSIAAALEATGPVDVLVNNAGIGAVGAFEATPMATTRDLFETNTFGVMAMTQAVLPQFRARRSGVVVNVTSSVTLTPMPLAAVYTASKTASKGSPPRLHSSSSSSTCGSSWLSRATARPRALRAMGDHAWKD
jgi:NADP-dependent 3-hydroxy acid dehydrogenase YdfG